MQNLRHYRNLAEAVRFELTDPCESPDFKSGAIDLSTTLPYLVEYPGIEPGMPEGGDFTDRCITIDASTPLFFEIDT